MRKIDDLVKHQMNRVLTTSSFESDQAAGCAEMRQTVRLGRSRCGGCTPKHMPVHRGLTRHLHNSWVA